MRVVHVNCARDPDRRVGDELLAAWPTLGAVAAAVGGAGAEVTVVQSSHVDATYELDGVRYHFVAEPALRGRPSGVGPGRLARTVYELDPDIIHLNGLGFPLHARSLSALGVPVLVQDHANRPPHRLARLHRWGLSRIAGVAFTAREQANPFFEAHILRPSLPVFAIPESSTHFRSGDLDAARAASGVYGDPALLWVGRLNANKDPLTIIDAVSMAAPRLPDVQLWCCFHEAPMLDAVRARLAAEPELAARVHLLGAVPHEKIEILCRAADFFVLASWCEGSGYALLEALACGATPVVSDIPAFRALTGGIIGGLAPPGHAAAFADQLVSLAAVPRHRLRAQAVDYFEAHLSFTVVGRSLIEAYRALSAVPARYRVAA